MKKPVTGSFALIKNLNTSCILHSIKEKGQISRADIARQTGLTPATVSNITAELIELGLIIETERGVSSGGRKPVMLKISSGACCCFGVHISSDIIEVALMDIDAEILWREKHPLRHGIQPKEAMQFVISLIQKARTHLNGRKAAGIGVCVHGLVRSEEGLSIYAPNLGWENVRIGDILQSEFNIPVLVENDVRAMTLAESWCGGARNNQDYVYLYIGAGIGGSVVINNELYKGYGEFAGEFGHTTIVPDGPLCSCGNRGCLQALASEYTMVNDYIRDKGIGSESQIEFTDVLNAAKSGDEVAIGEITKSARYIGIEIGNIINALSPSLIVVNGTITHAGNLLMSEIAGEVKARSLKYSHNRTRIVFSHLGDTAPLRGAAACVIKELFEHPKKYL